MLFSALFINQCDQCCTVPHLDIVVGVAVSLGGDGGDVHHSLEVKLQVLAEVGLLGSPGRTRVQPTVLDICIVMTCSIIP